jgi:hypothetical protein
VHFHGAAELVIESYRHAGLGDRVIVVINSGTVMSDYTSKYAGAAQWTNLLDQVAALSERSFERLALTGWSAGFGAVLRALQLEAEGERSSPRLDAVLLFDGFHAARGADGRWLEHTMDPVARFARLARDGERLFHLTHSRVPTPGYPSTTESTDALLALLELAPTACDERVPRPKLDILKQYPGPLELARVRAVTARDLSLEGYAGADARAHVGHVQFMSAIGLERLARRWQ